MATSSFERSDLIERFRIPLVWRLLNLPGEPSAKCGSPFREDRHPSFSIFDEGKAFKDHSTGQGGNVFRFYGIATATGALDEYAGFKDFLRSKGYSVGSGDARIPLVRASASNERFSRLTLGNDSAPGEENRSKPFLDRFRSPTLEDCNRIAGLRGISAAGPDIAGRLGTLLIGDVCGFESWILTDRSGKAAEARRFDGELYPAHEAGLHERKAHTLRGSKKNWPLGLITRGFETLEHINKILWVEGGPDYLAAWHWIVCYGEGDTLAVTMLGALAGTTGLDEQALTLLRGKRVRVIPHADAAGDHSRDWVALLRGIGCEVDRFLVERLSSKAKDLNDLTRILTPEQQTADASNILP